ncbi:MULTISPECIES: hypothetical protein [unclassified Microcoleus]|uniref:hypothetical protein n=1 Tax=unclassified Microcoleus TaxID=2642155 RepID=UPI002FD71109
MSVAPHSPHSIAYPNNLQTKTNRSITAGPIALGTAKSNRGDRPPASIIRH